jgi:hypothetical protein
MKKNVGSCKQSVYMHYNQRKYTRHMLLRIEIKKDGLNLQGSRDTVSDEALQAGNGLARNLDCIDDYPESTGPKPSK